MIVILLYVWNRSFGAELEAVLFIASSSTIFVDSFSVDILPQEQNLGMGAADLNNSLIM